MVLNDRQMLEVFECARACGALVMVHCEGYDAIKFMTRAARGARARRRPTITPFRGPQVVEREATHRAISHGELLDTPIMIVHVSGPRGDGADPLGAAARPQGLRRDLHAICFADRRRSQGPQHGRERRQICLLAAAARPRLVGGDLGRHPHRRLPDLLVRPLPVLLRGFGGQAEPEGAHLVPLGAERHSRRRGSRCRSSIRRASTRAASRSTNSSR